MSRAGNWVTTRWRGVSVDVTEITVSVVSVQINSHPYRHTHSLEATSSC